QITNNKQITNSKLQILTFYRTININNAKFIYDKSSINKDSKVPELREYSLSYLHHLFKIKEPLGQRLATLNNLEFYLDLMQSIRQSINKGTL
ncbi:tRNA-guanine transglycosylase, partial [Candidatus Parcubacteria bacterium]|nr:tRNA-guanine transglycosylase [Candidatus Parcubacteria bacterium]